MTAKTTDSAGRTGSEAHTTCPAGSDGDGKLPASRSVAEKFGVSARTARRWRRAGRSAESIATAARRKGRDGKTYRVRLSGGPRPSPVSTALRRLGYGLKSLDRLACRQGITAADRDALLALYRSVYELHGRWNEGGAA